MDSMSGDKWRTLWSMTVAQIWRSNEYRQKFLADPKAALKEVGITLPPGTEVKVLEDTDQVTWVPLTRDLEVRGTAADKFIHLFDNLIPIPKGKQIRLVQSTADTRYLVIPLQPKTMKTGELTEAELMSVAGGGTEATATTTTEATVAETTEVTVTETTEVQDAETTTTVVAEAELVAT